MRLVLKVREVGEHHPSARWRGGELVGAFELGYVEALVLVVVLLGRVDLEVMETVGVLVD